MGTVHRFPSEKVRGSLYGDADGPPAEIVVLPAVRIERRALHVIDDVSAAQYDCFCDVTQFSGPFPFEGLWRGNDE